MTLGTFVTCFMDQNSKVTKGLLSSRIKDFFLASKVYLLCKQRPFLAARAEEGIRLIHLLI